MATVSYLVMPIKLLPLIGERRRRMLQGADLPPGAGRRHPWGLCTCGEGARGPQGMGWDGDRAGEGTEKRQEEQKALVSGGQLEKGNHMGRRGFPGAAPGLMLGESSGVTG